MNFKYDKKGIGKLLLQEAEPGKIITFRKTGLFSGEVHIESEDISIQGDVYTGFIHKVKEVLGGVKLIYAPHSPRNSPTFRRKYNVHSADIAEFKVEESNVDLP